MLTIRGEHSKLILTSADACIFGQSSKVAAMREPVQIHDLPALAEPQEGEEKLLPGSIWSPLQLQVVHLVTLLLHMLHVHIWRESVLLTHR